METLIIYLFFVILVAVDSLQDSIEVKIRYSQNRTKQILFKYHALQSFNVLLSLLLVSWIGIFTPFHKANNLGDILYITSIIIGSYSLIRFAIFDYMFNIFTKQTIFHIGKYSIYDKILGTIVWVFRIGTIVWVFRKSELFAHWVIFLLKFTAFISVYQLLKLIIK